MKIKLKELPDSLTFKVSYLPGIVLGKVPSWSGYYKAFSYEDGELVPYANCNAMIGNYIWLNTNQEIEVDAEEYLEAKGLIPKLD